MAFFARWRSLFSAFFFASAMTSIVTTTCLDNVPAVARTDNLDGFLVWKSTVLHVPDHPPGGGGGIGIDDPVEEFAI